ncbi:MAG TPA: ATP-binding protein [Candidatus Angelobacter sp.]
MATAEMMFQPQRALRRRERRQRSALLRLLQVARPEEVFPLLLQEILGLGFPRAMALEADIDTGNIVPAATLRWPKLEVEKLSSALPRTGQPLTTVLHRAHPAVLPRSEFWARPIYLHPVLYTSPRACREAGHRRKASCLAVRNFRHERPIRLEEQVCSACHARGHAGWVVVELNRNNSEADLHELGELIELSGHLRSRLLKAEQDDHRMREMEVAIARMGTVMQSMADPVVLTDLHHRLIMQNAAAERLFKPQGKMSEGMGRAVELNNLLFSAALSSLVISGGGAYHDLTLVDVTEGEEMLFEAVSAPTYGPDAAQTGTVTVMHDVTDLRRADEELRANYEKLRQTEEIVHLERDRLNLIIENVGDPIIVCDRQARIVVQERLAEELFGPGPESPRSPAQAGNQAQLHDCIARFVASSAERETAPLCLFHPALKLEIEYDARMGKIFDENGQVSYTVTVLRDLTALRRVEQLKMERRMLEVEKFAATGRLAATIAHEVNNPMEAIKNAIYLLAGAIPENARPVYNILQSETERVARIVRQMLGLYRNAEHAKPANLNTIIEDTLLLLNRQLQRARVQIVSDLRPLPQAVVAADQMRQVLSNLVINARDAMPQGGRLLIRTRHVPGHDGLYGWIRILVADTGTGIPQEMIRAIFEPFVTTKGERGTGLGLWIVKGIVNHHTGRLSVRSREGVGSVFRIDLPVVKP